MMATAAEPPHPTAATLTAISTAAMVTAITLFTFVIRFDSEYQCRMAVRTDDGLLTDGCALLLSEWQSIGCRWLCRISAIWHHMHACCLNFVGKKLPTLATNPPRQFVQLLNGWIPVNQS